MKLKDSGPSWKSEGSGMTVRYMNLTPLPHMAAAGTTGGPMTPPRDFTGPEKAMAEAWEVMAQVSINY
jgi:hypothetical protein